MSKATLDLLDRLATKLGDLKGNKASDYRIAKELGVTRAAVSRWRAGHNAMGDEVAVTVAERLGDNPAYVLARLHEDMAETPAVRKVYKQIAATFAGKAAAAVVAALLSGHATNSEASTSAPRSPGSNFAYTICYVKL